MVKKKIVRKKKAISKKTTKKTVGTKKTVAKKSTTKKVTNSVNKKSNDKNKKYITKIKEKLSDLEKLLSKLKKTPGSTAILTKVAKISRDIMGDSLLEKQYHMAHLAKEVNRNSSEDHYMADKYLQQAKKRLEDIKKGRAEKELAAPKPQNEKKRVAAVRKLKQLDTDKEDRFDRITQVAVDYFQVPISTITLIDENREWHKSCQGLTEREGKRKNAFCSYTILTEKVLIIPDTKKDARFASNPMVTGYPFLRFYAGTSLYSTDGYKLGTFCVKDVRPRKFSRKNLMILKNLAKWAELELNAGKLSEKLESVRRDLEQSYS